MPAFMIVALLFVPLDPSGVKPALYNPANNDNPNNQYTQTYFLDNLSPSLDPTEVKQTLYQRRDAPKSLQPLQVNDYTKAQYYAENKTGKINAADIVAVTPQSHTNIHSNSASNHSLANNNTTATTHIESAFNYSHHSSHHSNLIHSPVQPAPGAAHAHTRANVMLNTVTVQNNNNGIAMMNKMIVGILNHTTASATESISTAYNKTDIVPKLDSLTDSGDKNSDALLSNNSPTNGGPVSSETEPTLYPHNYVAITLKAHTHADMRKALETGLHIMFLYFIFYVNNNDNINVLCHVIHLNLIGLFFLVLSVFLCVNAVFSLYLLYLFWIKVKSLAANKHFNLKVILEPAVKYAYDMDMIWKRILMKRIIYFNYGLLIVYRSLLKVMDTKWMILGSQRPLFVFCNFGSHNVCHF